MTTAAATLSTHILNLEAGAPAEGLAVQLRATNSSGDAGPLLAEQFTNADGRAGDWPTLEPGSYELRFAVSDWYSAQDLACFYPRVRIDFVVDSIRHYHVPLLLNRFGFSSYRGS